MTDFTVEATVAAVMDDDWSALRRITDLVPGTLLIEDPEEPKLIFPVEAESPMLAVLFVDGVAKLAELKIVSGAVYPAPPIDFEYDEDDDSEGDTEVTRAVSDWMDRLPPLDGHLTRDGVVEFA